MTTGNSWQDDKAMEADAERGNLNKSNDDPREGGRLRLNLLADQIWAMHSGHFASLCTAATAPVAPQGKVPRLPASKGSVAVLPIMGVIAQRLDWYADVSTEWLGRMLDELMASPLIGAIVLNVDSPGGVVYGTPELGDKIRGYRDQKGAKPIYAVANSTAFSAAYWLASQAQKLFVAPSGEVGSIGVWQAHVDISGYEEKMGVKTTLVSAGKYKVEGHPFAPLDEEARSEMQRGVDRYYGMFLDAVAKGRGVSSKDVRDNYGGGRLIDAEQAVKLGMADGVATLDEVISGLVKTQQNGKAAAADLSLREVEIALRERK